MKKSKARRRKARKARARMKDDDLKFQLSLDASYGLTRGELTNMARSYGASKRKSKSYARKLRPRRRGR